MKYDFCGYATRSNVKCSDGRTIMKDAFRDDDGKKVPLVWNHDHGKASSVLGHGILENRDDGVYVYASFNNTPEAQRAKELVRHGDITALSIFANKLKETAGRVMHGVIREVSLVMAGANPEAYIDSYVAHSDGSVSLDSSQGLFYSGMDGELYHAEDTQSDDEDGAELDSDTEMTHADDEDEEDEEETESEGDAPEEDEDEVRLRRIERAVKRRKAAQGGDSEEDDSDEEEPEEDEDMDDSDDEEEDDGDEKRRVRHAEDSDDDEEDSDEDDGETVGDVLDTFTDKQKVVVMAMLENALAAASKEMEHSDEEEDTMKKNLFEQGEMEEANTLSHSDEMKILEMAKTPSIGSLKSAIDAFCSSESLAHGFDTESLTLLFPEYKDLKTGAPEMLTDDQGWISKVLAKVSKSMLTHIRVRFTDIRDMTNLRAKGYKQKGDRKTLTGDVSVLYRTTDPQTVYVRSDLHRDDVLDIQDFDYVAYMYNIDRMAMNEELATAILMGDGRDISDQYKIREDKIIPIWTDDELFTIHRTVDFDAMRQSLQGTATGTYFGDNFVYAETFVQELLYGREDAKNLGQGDLYVAPHVLNTMLLARDRNGRRIYNTVEELRSALNVNSIITVEQFEDKVRTDKEGNEKKLLAIVVDLKNYQLGCAKGGEITHFTDFDINFNILQSLLETRTSGMNTRPLSALVLEEDYTSNP